MAVKIKSKLIGVSVNEEKHKEIETIADSLGISMAEYGRVAIDEKIEREKRKVSSAKP